MAFYDNMFEGGWAELAKESQAQSTYNPGKKPREARELIVMIPNEMEKYRADQLARRYAEDFSRKYGVPCAAAIHWNKKKNNYHAHIVFSERKILEQIKESIATRNTYFDAAGKRSTKKLCCGADGNLLPGCRLVRKGENLSEGKVFGAKEEMFATRDWLRSEKQRQVDFVNQHVTGEKWVVYDKNTNPHIPRIRLKTGEPEGLRAWKERENEMRELYNKQINELLENGEITGEQALLIKQRFLQEQADRREEKAAERQYAKENPSIYKQTRIRVVRDTRVQRMMDEIAIAEGRKTSDQRRAEKKIGKLAEQVKNEQGLDAMIANANAIRESQERERSSAPWEKTNGEIGDGDR